jgi:hypothetical protein
MMLDSHFFRSAAKPSIFVTMGFLLNRARDSLNPLERLRVCSFTVPRLGLGGE